MSSFVGRRSVVVMERLPLGVALAPGKVCAQQARLGNIQAKRAAIMRYSSVALAGGRVRAHQPHQHLVVVMAGRADIMRHSRGMVFFHWLLCLAAFCCCLLCLMLFVCCLFVYCG